GGRQASGARSFVARAPRPAQRSPRLCGQGAGRHPHLGRRAGGREGLSREKASLLAEKMKLLVANRSEIACRIFQACREMGIPTVAIVAPGDEEARHLTYADEVVPVASYLDVKAVVGAAQKAKATLIHPGYGFLSERPAFAAAV